MNLRYAMPALLGLALVSLHAMPAAADDDEGCKTLSPGQTVDQAMVKSKAESLGITVRSVENDHGCVEVKGMKDGKRVEAYFDPTSGELVESQEDS